MFVATQAIAGFEQMCEAFIVRLVGFIFSARLPCAGCLLCSEKSWILFFRGGRGGGRTWEPQRVRG